MYCPPESGNIEPNSAKATHAHRGMAPPKTQTRKYQTGCGSGPAISFAVRKIDEPMIPLTRSKTESSRLSPRTRPGFCSDLSVDESASETGAVFMFDCDQSFVRVRTPTSIWHGHVNPLRARPGIPEASRNGGR